MGSHIGLFRTENDARLAVLVAFYWAFGVIAVEGLLAFAIWRLL